MEPVGPSGDQPHVVVQSFGPGIVHAELNGCQDSFTKLRMVLATLTEGSRREREAFEHHRSSSCTTLAGSRSPAKIAWNAS